MRVKVVVSCCLSCCETPMNCKLHRFLVIEALNRNWIVMMMIVTKVIWMLNDHHQQFSRLSNEGTSILYPVPPGFWTYISSFFQPYTLNTKCPKITSKCLILKANLILLIHLYDWIILFLSGKHVRKSLYIGIKYKIAHVLKPWLWACICFEYKISGVHFHT